MAFVARDVNKRGLEGFTNAHPRRKVSAGVRQNMKEGNISQEKLASVVNRVSGGQRSVSDQHHYKVVVRKRKALHQALSPASGRKHQKGWGCDMANKENEIVAGNLHEKLHNDRHSFVVNSSDSGASQTEGASSKYSSFFSEVSKDHDTMAQVLFSRNLRLNVALTFWRKHSVNELVAYLVRMQDLGVLADCLPVLTNSLQEDKDTVSVGCCVDLLPLVKSLLISKFEEYVIVGLNWLQAIVKKWWPQLSTSSEELLDENVQILRQQLSELWPQESHLASVPGYTGKIAKDLDGYLSQLR